MDDTLVTCAEYQLFIDEMREEGKYYRPDHWSSYQFPEGQAREPILGIRHSDVTAFCDWLSGRDAGNWQYRLPTSTEAGDHPIRLVSGQSLLSYWVAQTTEKLLFSWENIRSDASPRKYHERKFQIEWAVPIPNDACGITVALTRQFSLDFPLELDRHLERARNRPLDLDRPEVNLLMLPMSSKLLSIGFATATVSSTNILITVSTMISAVLLTFILIFIPSKNVLQDVLPPSKAYASSRSGNELATH